MSPRAILRSPLFWILAAATLLRLAGIAWGLPASDGWDDDGFAPRNFLTALALTYKPGAYFTYPPLHAFVLAILTMPGWIAALAHAPSWARADVVGEFIKVPTMTYFAVTARLVNVAMSLGLIAAIGAMAELVAGRRAGLFAAAACALNMVLTYYSQVSNLDVPYLFWCALSLLWAMQAIARHQPRRFGAAALFAAAAVATKDQAYAIFLIAVPAILLLWFAADAWPRAQARAVLLRLLLWALVAVALLGLVDGAFTNPGGFARRLAFLLGPASGDYAAYPASWAGRLALLGDMARYFTHGFALVGTLLAGLGLMAHAGRARARPAWIAGLLPFLAMLSFTLSFNLMAFRLEARFLLPQAVLAAVYIGIAADRLTATGRDWFDRTAWAGLAAAALYALYLCAAVGAAFLDDPRYDAERWLAAHAAPGDSIGTYGQDAYLPRFPKGVGVFRVGQTPLELRNPLPGVTELRQPFAAPFPQNPRFLVVSSWWAAHYLGPENARVPPQFLKDGHPDPAARRYFAALYGGRTGWRLAHRAGPVPGFWRIMHIHESLDEPIQIFERH